MSARAGKPPTAGDLEEIAARVFETIPETLRKHAAEVRIRVEDFPSAEVMREMALE